METKATPKRVWILDLSYTYWSAVVPPLLSHHHLHTLTVISPKKVFTLFSNQSAASTFFPNLALCVKSFPTPGLVASLVSILQNLLAVPYWRS